MSTTEQKLPSQIIADEIIKCIDEYARNPYPYWLDKKNILEALLPEIKASEDILLDKIEEFKNSGYDSILE